MIQNEPKRLKITKMRRKQAKRSQNDPNEAKANRKQTKNKAERAKATQNKTKTDPK